MMAEPKNKKQKSFKPGKGVVSKSVRDYGNDPFFIKKAEEGRKFLEKAGFPEWPKDKK